MTRRTIIIRLFSASIGARFALGKDRPNKRAAKDLPKQPAAPEVKTLFSGLGFGESPRWHKDRLWFSNWGKQEVVAVDHKGQERGDGAECHSHRSRFASPGCLMEVCLSCRQANGRCCDSKTMARW